MSTSNSVLETAQFTMAPTANRLKKTHTHILYIYWSILQILSKILMQYFQRITHNTYFNAQVNQKMSRKMKKSKNE